MGLIVDKNTSRALFESTARDVGMSSLPQGGNQGPLQETPMTSGAPPQGAMPQGPQGGPMGQEGAGGPMVQDADPREEAFGLQILTNYNNFIAENPEAVINELRGAENVPEIIGDITASFVQSQVAAAEAAENPVPEEILLSVGTEIVDDLFQLAEEVGVYRADEGQQTIDVQAAVNHATQLFLTREAQRGAKAPEDFARLRDSIRLG